MPHAWQVRESERQSLLESLFKRILEFEDKREEVSKTFTLDLSISVLEYLRVACKPIGERRHAGTLSEVTPAARIARGYLDGEILPRIKNFSDSQIERDYLIALLMDRFLIRDAIRKFTSAMTREEFDNPRAVFGAESATEDIPFRKK